MFRCVILALGLFALVGCGSSQRDLGASVKGTVTYKGKPVNGATMSLYPKTGNYITIGLSQEGTFEAVDVAEGEYVVVLQPTKGFAGPSTKGMDPAKAAEMQTTIEEMKRPATIPFPKKYTKQATSDLKMTVTKGNNQPVELVLSD
jgi:hypothetical protein